MPKLNNKWLYDELRAILDIYRRWQRRGPKSTDSLEATVEKMATELIALMYVVALRDEP